ncbi:hypothetical protein LY76DRAFT_605877 [Colletotrichum caudatum]|nr:hypothetical protein LY76DRAFT_605877 [Colletotrichum caudatum]
MLSNSSWNIHLASILRLRPRRLVFERSRVAEWRDLVARVAKINCHFFGRCEPNATKTSDNKVECAVSDKKVYVCEMVQSVSPRPATWEALLEAIHRQQCNDRGKETIRVSMVKAKLTAHARSRGCESDHGLEPFAKSATQQTGSPVLVKPVPFRRAAIPRESPTDSKGQDMHGLPRQTTLHGLPKTATWTFEVGLASRPRQTDEEREPWLKSVAVIAGFNRAGRELRRRPWREREGAAPSDKMPSAFASAACTLGPRIPPVGL